VDIVLVLIVIIVVEIRLSKAEQIEANVIINTNNKQQEKHLFQILYNNKLLSLVVTFSFIRQILNNNLRTN